MNNFIFQNPVRIIFGKGVIADLPAHIPAGSKILMTCGGGSIRANGVYDQVKKALSGFQVLEFWGIEPNPHYETCMKAVEICRREKITFLLSVGGGSVLDAPKFISLAAFYTKGDPWGPLLQGRHSLADHSSGLCNYAACHRLGNEFQCGDLPRIHP
jgi:NADP-dependent alcohol dehydrogenase